MRRIVLPILSLLAVACSSEIDEVVFDEVNKEIVVGENPDETAKEETFNLSIEAVDEKKMLTEAQKELITYFQYLTFWKGPSHTPNAFNQKWGSSMKLYLSGTISAEYKTTVARVISQYNSLFVDGDFDIALTDNEDNANAVLFFGTQEEVETVWTDMYDIIKDGNYSGYTITPSQNSVLISSRIWISNTIEVLFKHELGHALGFGHSNKCDDEDSFLCSQISTDNDILSVEADIIRYAYHRDVSAGQSEAQIEEVLAHIIVNQQ